VFQSKKGEVFGIENTVQHWDAAVSHPRHETLMLVDADGSFHVPSDDVLEGQNLQIVLTSSPRTKDDRKWLRQYSPYDGRTVVMEPWTKEELFLSVYVHPTRTTSSTHP
jgi:hypothetical protein